MKISIRELKKQKGKDVINQKELENYTPNISQTDIETIASNVIRLVRVEGESNE